MKKLRVLRCSIVAALVVAGLALWACNLGGSSERPRHCDAEANCQGRECGPDGCGGDGQCGICGEGAECRDFLCVSVGVDPCVPDCDGRECGPDGCDGSCGTCPPDRECNTEFGTCYDPGGCLPLCDDRECGWDGCDGSCGTCQDGWICDDGRCVEQGVIFCDPTTEAPCLDCGELLSCVGSCSTGDQACYDSCYSAASEEAYLQMMAMYDCLEQHCPASLSSTEWASCAEAALQDPDRCQAVAEPCGVGGSGSVFCDPALATDCLDCAGLASCLYSCPDDDLGCYDDCYYGATEEAYEQWVDMWDCVDEYCPSSLSDSEWSSCVDTALNDPARCQALAEPCLGGGGGDEFVFCDPETALFCLDCEGLMNCLSACADQACYDLCFSLSAEEGYEQWAAMWDCFHRYCPDTMSTDSWIECVNGAANDSRCQAVAEPCLGSGGGSFFCDPATSTTCLDCKGLSDCLDSCPENRPSCYDYCYSRATEQAYEQWAALWECYDLWCPDTMPDPLWFECVDAASNDFRCQTQAAFCL
ncbi:MAG: hypothetical protein JW797_04420 [Bradymonadales bacterium]|nr:hypothetical protein [Bradymonadales bacterium]